MATKKKSPKVRMGRHPKSYPFYVVLKNNGVVLAAAEYREDAEEMRGDLPVSKAFTQVLTAAGLKRKFGEIIWS